MYCMVSAQQTNVSEFEDWKHPPQHFMSTSLNALLPYIWLHNCHTIDYHMYGFTTLQCVLHDAHVINSHSHRGTQAKALLPDHIKVVKVLSSVVQAFILGETPKWVSIFIDSSLLSVVFCCYELHMTILGQALQWLSGLSGLESHNITTIEWSRDAERSIDSTFQLKLNSISPSHNVCLQGHGQKQNYECYIGHMTSGWRFARNLYIYIYNITVYFYYLFWTIYQHSPMLPGIKVLVGEK